MTPHCDKQVKANKNYKHNTKLIFIFMISLKKSKQFETLNQGNLKKLKNT